MPLLEKCYMRRHSEHIRIFSKRKLKTCEEDKIDESMTGSLRIIVLILCRNRERLLSQVFQRWKESVDVDHDYDDDMRIILLRRLGSNERRSELEIEVMYKWVLQNHEKDSTGLSFMLFSCKKKTFVVDALQQCRMEIYLPGETVVIQGDLPRIEDGQFTILSGTCDFIIFDADSMALLKLRSLPDKARHDVSKDLLQLGRVINELGSGCGFGELSSLSKVKRPTSVRAGMGSVLEFIILPRKNVASCFSKCRGPPVAEAIDFLRQASMGHRVTSSEVLVGASAMTKRVLPMGTIMYYKGQPVNKVFLVVNGEVLLDTEGSMPQKDGPLPFQNPDGDKCYCMAGQSILGDEGLSGVNKNYETTAVVISEFATIFEVSAAGKEFLLRRFELERYSALAYKDQMIQTSPLNSLENVILLHSSFNNLRKAISVAHRDRGVKPTNVVVDESGGKQQQSDTADIQISEENEFYNTTVRDVAAIATPTPLLEYNSKLNKNCLRNAVRVKKFMQKRSLDQLRVAAKDSILSDDMLAGIGTSSVSAAHTKNAAVAEDKVQRALSAFYERRLLLKEKNQDAGHAGMNIANHSMSMLMSAASNVMNDEDGELHATPSYDDSSYNGSMSSVVANKSDPTSKIREHIRLLEEAQKTGAARLTEAQKMEESLRLPIASISLEQSSSMAQGSSMTPATVGHTKSTLSDPAALASLLNRHFLRVSTRRSQKTLDYCEGLSDTRNFSSSVGKPKKVTATKTTRMKLDLMSSSVHPCTLFPESKEALLHTLRERWDVDPDRKTAVQTGLTTPRYFKLSNNGQHCDPLRSLQTLLDKTSDRVSLSDAQSEASFGTRSSLMSSSGKGKANITVLLDNADSLAMDAFLITTHRQERYESPTSSRHGTPSAACRPRSPMSAAAGEGHSDIPIGRDDAHPGNLNSYFERMKTPPGEYDMKINAAAEKKKNGSASPPDTPTALEKRWGKIRTAVSISSALDPDRALKQYERALRLEPKTSKYLEGKRNSAGVSKYSLAPMKQLTANGDTVAEEFFSSVNMWKQETLQELFQTKNEAKRSVPVLSSSGAQAMYWEKQIVETIPKYGETASRHPTYHEVNTIRQNSESQRYKRRLKRTKC